MFPSHDRKDDDLNSEVLCKTMWIRPMPEFEDGLVVVVIGDQLAYIDTFPNDYGENIYPYVDFSERQDGYHFWPQATVERLIPIQNAYQRLSQKKLKNAYLMANGKYLLAKGSQVIESSLNSTSGEVVEYNPSVPAPTQLQLAPLPNYVAQMQQQLLTDFADVGQQRPSSVSPPANLSAGIAIQISSELADDRDWERS